MTQKMTQNDEYSLIKLAIDTEDAVKQLGGELDGIEFPSDDRYGHYYQRFRSAQKTLNRLQPPEPDEPPPPIIPTITKTDLNNPQKLRSLFPDKDITKMLVNGELKVINEPNN